MSWREYPLLEERIWQKTLENGLTLAVVPRAGFRKKLAYFVTDLGSIHTEFWDDHNHYEVPAGIANVLLVVNGDVNGDGKITGVDKGQLNAAVLGKVTLSAGSLFGADVSNDGRLTGVDKGQLNAVILGKTAFSW